MFFVFQFNDLKEHQKKSSGILNELSISTGFEPGIFSSEVRRLIH